MAHFDIRRKADLDLGGGFPEGGDTGGFYPRNDILFQRFYVHSPFLKTRCDSIKDLYIAEKKTRIKGYGGLALNILTLQRNGRAKYCGNRPAALVDTLPEFCHIQPVAGPACFLTLQ
jgi:hypothetical protein